MSKLKSSPIVKKVLKKRVLLPIIAVMLWLALFVRHWGTITAVSADSGKSRQEADCAVVLTGGSGRVREGFDLLSRKQIKKLIISGVNEKSQLREIMPQMFLYGDIQEKDIILDRRSLTTYGNAQQSLPFVEALRCRDVMVVTSTLHMYRAMKTFRATFPSSIEIVQHAVPATASEAGPWDVGTEVLKSMFYAVWAY